MANKTTLKRLEDELGGFKRMQQGTRNFSRNLLDVAAGLNLQQHENGVEVSPHQQQHTTRFINLPSNLITTVMVFSIMMILVSFFEVKLKTIIYGLTTLWIIIIIWLIFTSYLKKIELK
ncbi:unnamed protein product [Adineta steineri]|uniref:Uncharacterized protein n=1 Tax=Adineta steineri TaxID=433720 RepID=A0A818JIA8_9BILA|nr:unnamed protein product [Adineta steineri]CAF0842112.1 unnamed protein product [Adineta steineri]CAF0854693.1 unnamed protein product [Adineta steineri]CAF3542428.1 unnamed protein product [Adineta steineri]CAF3544134.1 unnamed protein product [Adineta steineri]